jgi:hypothetical protein
MRLNPDLEWEFSRFESFDVGSNSWVGFFQIVIFFRVAFWGFVFMDVEDDGDECGVFIIFQ